MYYKKKQSVESMTNDEIVKWFLVENGISFIKSNNAWRAFGFPNGYPSNIELDTSELKYKQWVALDLFMEGINEGFFMIGGCQEDDEKYIPLIRNYLTDNILNMLGLQPGEKDKLYDKIVHYLQLINKEDGFNASRISFKETFPLHKTDNDLIARAELGMLIQNWVFRTHIDETMGTPYTANDKVHDEYFKRGCDKILSILSYVKI